MSNNLDMVIPDDIPGWKVITHESFESDTGKILPKQYGGVDCGAYVAMYLLYLVENAKFDFSSSDMVKIRHWFLSLVTEISIDEQFCSWIRQTRNSNRFGGLTFTCLLYTSPSPRDS